MSSFSPEAIRVLLNLPEEIDARRCVGVCFPARPPAHMPSWPKKKLRVVDLVKWGPYPSS